MICTFVRLLSNWRCHGVRQCGQRKFVESPPLVFFQLYSFFRQGTFRSLHDIPDAITICETVYSLMAATFFDVGHYTAAFYKPRRQLG